MPPSSIMAKQELLEIIRVGTLKKSQKILPGLELEFKCLQKHEIDAANAATARRLATSGINPLDAFAREPIVQEEQLALAIQSWNGIKVTYEENLQTLQSIQSQLFGLVWTGYTSVAMFQGVEFGALMEQLKNSSGSPLLEPSGTSSEPSQIQAGSAASSTPTPETSALPSSTHGPF